MGKSPDSRGRDLRPVGIADALFSKVQQRVLGVFFSNPGRSFYASEVIALAGSGSGAVQRELARLEGAGLLTMKRVGNQKHYQANPDSPVFAELRTLVLKTSGLADVLRAALAPLAPDIRAAFVFGSMAKGEDTASSDVDLMVLSDTLGHADLFEALQGAEQRLARRVNPAVYAPEELGARQREGISFVTRVLEQPKIWLIGSADDLPA